VRDADHKDVYELARELAALSEKARAGKLAAAEMQGGCFTVSSLGGIGGTAFTPIINAPEVAILGVSRSATRPVFEGGAFVPRLMLPLSLSYDHRVIDGADAVRFTTALGKLLGSRGVAGGDPVSRDGSVDVKIPDLGDFKDVAVIDVLIKAGDTVAVDTPLITLETEKATMDIPSPAAGVIAEVTVRTGERVNTGSVIAACALRAATSGPRDTSRKDEPRHTGLARIGTLRRRAIHGYGADRTDGKRRQTRGRAWTRPTGRPRSRRRPLPRLAASYDFDLAVLGAGPGGYTAAFPRRRSRPQGRADRALAAARRCVSQRRLHPIEGAAACGARHRRGG
jgi:pyruvate/2-oxoglutarate dehydrogenase complex dihydrolipoamide acyltransferase (E2) component